MKQVAEVIGIALSRVSQIHTAAIGKLKAPRSMRPPASPRPRHDSFGERRCEHDAEHAAQRRISRAEEKHVEPCNFRSAGQLSNESARVLTSMYEILARNVMNSLDVYLGDRARGAALLHPPALDG